LAKFAYEQISKVLNTDQAQANPHKIPNRIKVFKAKNEKNFVFMAKEFYFS